MYSENGEYRVSVCFSPLSWHLFEQDGALVIVTDIFRASTAMCAAFHNKVKAIIPVERIEESQKWKSKGYVSAGERDGKTLACADFGNSPFNFSEPGLQGKIIVMNTTNGTKAIRLAAKSNSQVVIGAFTNLTAVCTFAVHQRKEIIILCAGWKDRFSLEDTLFAGAATEKIITLGNGQFHTMCDSAIASADLWQSAKNDPLTYIEKAAHRHRLKRLGLDDILEYSLTIDSHQVVPILKDNRLIDIKSL